MSCYMNPVRGQEWSTGRAYRKQSDFILGASQTWVTIDENPASINDGWFVHASQTSFVDYPASYHNSAGGLSFADGHSEIKKVEIAHDSHLRSSAEVRPGSGHAGRDLALRAHDHLLNFGFARFRSFDDFSQTANLAVFAFVVSSSGHPASKAGFDVRRP